MIALYVRVSTQEQAAHGYSVGEQTQRLQAYAQAIGEPDFKVFTDAGFSGGNTERPALQQMISEISSFSKVVVYKLDRLSRSQKDTLTLIEDVFLKNGVDFISVSESFDTSTPYGRAIVGFLAVFAQLEREQIKERMSMGKDARAQKGLYHGSRFSPIGFDYADSRLVPNEDADLVREAFRLSASGMPTKRIVLSLNERGATHRYGSWNVPTMRKLLSSRLYIGEISHNGVWYKGEHPAIVPEDIFYGAQDTLAFRREQSFSHNRTPSKATSYLGGLLVCGHCGAKYGKRTAKRYKSDDCYRYYICNSQRKVNTYVVRDPNCHNKRWKMEELDSIVFAEVSKLRLTEPRERDNAKERDFIRKRISSLREQISRLADLYSVGGISREIIEKKTADLNSQISQLRKSADEIPPSSEEVAEAVRSCDDILRSGDFENIRHLLLTLIDHIELNGEDVTFYWRF